MKAPDKIYVPYEAESNYISDRYYLGPTPKMENAEYIRKDALIEWIQEVRAIPHENAVARDLAFQEIINKINSI